MFLELLILLFTNLFGSNLKRRPTPPRIPVPDDPDSLDPVSPIPSHHYPPTGTVPIHPAPNILIPDPANRDNHGPASSIARAMLAKGYTVFEKDDQPHNLNIIGIRAKEPEFDRFKCRLVHFWKHQGEWQLVSWPITTLPGERYMVDKLLSPLGCAILAPGQHRDAYGLRLHRGVYQAMCQNDTPVPVYRDKDRDRVYDMVPASIQRGAFGINIHATENPDDGIDTPVLSRIGSHSAGCQVFARVQDFVDGREQWRLARSLYGNTSTYTLLEGGDLDDPGTVPAEAVAPQISDPGETWNPGTKTVGLRNRNLLNVKQGSDPWKYSTGKDGKGHTIFPSYAKGLRAGIITLRTYYVTHKLRTIADILARWAPTTDTVGSIPGAPANSPAAYSQFVAKRMGIKPTDRLLTFNEAGQIRSPDELFKLISAMAEMENYTGLQVPRSIFDEALTLL